MLAFASIPPCMVLLGAFMSDFLISSSNKRSCGSRLSKAWGSRCLLILEMAILTLLASLPTRSMRPTIRGKQNYCSSTNSEFIENPDILSDASHRCSAVCAYVTPFTNRTNLKVITNATVSRIIWSNVTSASNGLVRCRSSRIHPCKWNDGANSSGS